MLSLSNLIFFPKLHYSSENHGKKISIFFSLLFIIVLTSFLHNKSVRFCLLYFPLVNVFFYLTDTSNLIVKNIKTDMVTESTINVKNDQDFLY